MSGVKVSTRGDYASRALLSLALHAESEGPTSVRDIAERTGAPPALPRADPAGAQGRRPRALQARRRRRLRARPRRRARSRSSEIVSAVDGPIVAGDFGEPHQDGACDHEGQCVLLAVWAEVGEHMRQLLGAITLADIAAIAQGEAPWPDVDAGRPESSTPRERSVGRPARSAPAEHARRRSSGSGDGELDGGSPVTGWSKPSVAGVQERAGHDERLRGRRGSGRRRPPGGRWPRGARGSGGCGRSRACTASSATSTGSVEACSTPRSGCGRRGPRSVTAMRVGSRGERPIGASIDAVGDVRVAPHERVVAPVDRRGPTAGRPASS